MARLVGLVAAALVLLLLAAFVVGQWRERAVYEQLAEHSQRLSEGNLTEYRSVGVGR